MGECGGNDLSRAMSGMYHRAVMHSLAANGSGQHARRRTLPVVLAAVAAICLLSFLAIPGPQRIQVYQDDALFYGIIAWNTAHGHPFSFDGGASRTTGFHWGGLLVPFMVASATHAFSEGATYGRHFQVLFLVDAAVLALCAFLVALVAARGVPSVPGTALLLLIVSQTLVPGFGMEQVYLPLLLLLLIGLEPERRGAWIGYLSLSWLAVLVRTDAFLIVLALAVYLCVLQPLRSGPAPGRARAALCICLPSAAGVLLGLAVVAALNAAVGGSMLSSSTLVKAAMGHLSASGLASAFLARLPYLFLFVLVLAVSLVQPQRRFLAPAVTGAGLLALIYVTLLRSLGNTNLGSWYDVTWRCLLVLGIALVWSRISSLPLVGRRSRFARQALLLGGLILFCTPWMPRDLIRLRLRQGPTGEPGYWEDLAEAGRRIRESTRPETRLFVSDLPGRLTYFTSRPVMALDGLANSPEYVRRYLLPRRIDAYLERQSGDLLLLLSPKQAARLDSIAASAPGATGSAPVGFPYGSGRGLSEFRFPLSQVRFRCPRSSGKGEIWVVALPGRP